MIEQWSNVASSRPGSKGGAEPQKVDCLNLTSLKSRTKHNFWPILWLKENIFEDFRGVALPGYKPEC